MTYYFVYCMMHDINTGWRKVLQEDNCIGSSQPVLISYIMQYAQIFIVHNKIFTQFGFHNNIDIVCKCQYLSFIHDIIDYVKKRTSTFSFFILLNIKCLCIVHVFSD